MVLPRRAGITCVPCSAGGGEGERTGRQTRDFLASQAAESENIYFQEMNIRRRFKSQFDKSALSYVCTFLKLRLCIRSPDFAKSTPPPSSISSTSSSFSLVFKHHQLHRQQTYSVTLRPHCFCVVTKLIIPTAVTRWSAQTTRNLQRTTRSSEEACEWPPCLEFQ